MLSLSTLIAAGSMVGLAAAQREITIKNQCSETIWPAMYTDTNVSPSKPEQPTGWEMTAGEETSFNVPKSWNGRIWGRRDCDFSGDSTGPDTCATGGCNGGLECTDTGTGVPPTTLAEFTLDSEQGDWYDVSLVDGFSVTMTLTNNADCPEASCTTNINEDCPSELQMTDESGNIIACNTACGANLDGNASNSPNCCSGDYDTPETCPREGIEHLDVFKDACPNAYAYAYDENGDHTVLFRCDNAKEADYTVTFCPTDSTADAGSVKRSNGLTVPAGWGSRR